MDLLPYDVIGHEKTTEIAQKVTKASLVSLCARLQYQPYNFVFKIKEKATATIRRKKRKKVPGNSIPEWKRSGGVILDPPHGQEARDPPRVPSRNLKRRKRLALQRRQALTANPNPNPGNNESPLDDVVQYLGVRKLKNRRLHAVVEKAF